MTRSASLIACTALFGALTNSTAMSAPVRHIAGPVQQVLTASDTAAQTTNSDGFVDVPGAYVRLTIPAGGRQLVVARFTGETSCSGPTLHHSCMIRILARNAEMAPASNYDFDMDTVESTSFGDYTGAAADRSIVLNPGIYFVKVQYEVSYPDTYFTLDDWHLTVEAAPLQ